MDLRGPGQAYPAALRRWRMPSDLRSHWGISAHIESLLQRLHSQHDSLDLLAILSSQCFVLVGDTGSGVPIFGPNFLLGEALYLHSETTLRRLQCPQTGKL